MAQVAPTSFGYSARALFGKDHRRKPLSEDDYSNKDLSDDAKKLLKYMSQLKSASGRQFDNIVGRLHHLLRTTGAELLDEECLNDVFADLRDFALDDKYSRSARWKILELIELQANDWEDVDDIVEYYENPSNFEVPEVNNNKPPISPTSQASSHSPLRLPHQEKGALCAPPHRAGSEGPLSPQSVGSSSGVYEGSSICTTSPESLRSRTPSGESSATRCRVSSGGSSATRSRISSEGSTRSRNTSGRGEGAHDALKSRGSVTSVISRQSSSLVEEDVFHDAAESFQDNESNSSGDSDGSSRLGSESSSKNVNPPATMSPAKFRLMQISSGKLIKYTRNFLLGCWASPYCEVMPSNLQHTIANSDISFIITGPPFRNPISIIATKTEPATTLIAPPPPALHSMSVPPPPPPMLMRSLSMPAVVPSVVHAPVIRSMSSSGQMKMGGVTYYEIPAGMPSNYVPILQKDAWQKLFKASLQQMNTNKS